MARTKATTDHRVIRRWVEDRGGHPARVEVAGDGGRGRLCIDFPGFATGEAVRRITWAEWLDLFEGRRLAFLYLDRADDGQVSRFNRLVDRTAEEARSAPT